MNTNMMGIDTCISSVDHLMRWNLLDFSTSFSLLLGRDFTGRVLRYPCSKLSISNIRSVCNCAFIISRVKP